MSAETRTFNAWIGLGSNLASSFGDREATLRSAVRHLASAGSVTAVSSIWETQPVGLQEQPLFLNAAVVLDTGLEPAALLHQLLQIERHHGRQRSAEMRNGPRPLDLDLLLVESRSGPVISSESGLTLPHPQLHLRRFVLAPLAEIAPRVTHPVLRKTIAELLDGLPPAAINCPASVRRFGPLGFSCEK